MLCSNTTSVGKGPISWLRRRSATWAVAQAVRKLVFGQEVRPFAMDVLKSSSDDRGAPPDWLKLALLVLSHGAGNGGDFQDGQQAQVRWPWSLCTAAALRDLVLHVGDGG